MLIDTQVLVWARAASHRLRPRARTQLETAPVVYFSPISLVELRIKAMSGKLSIPAAVLDDPSVEGYVELPLRAGHVAALGDFPALTAHDPFDRILVAQASAERIQFLTADRRLLALGESWVFDARM